MAPNSPSLAPSSPYWITGSAKPKPASAHTIYADGSGGTAYREGPDIELSHWDPNRTPERYRAELSTQICMRFLEDNDHAPYDLVVNNHVDADGLLSVYTLCHPDIALANREVLEQAAGIGDFWNWGPPAAQALFQGLALISDREAAAGTDPGELYARCFARVPALISAGADDPEVRDGLAALRRSDAFVDSDAVAREQIGARLAVYTVDAAAYGPDQLTRLLAIPGFNEALSDRCTAWPQSRARRDLERVQLLVVRVPGGWIYDLCYPGYAWADTVDLWRAPALSLGTSESSPLRTALAQLQAIEGGRGQWTHCEGRSLILSTLPGRSLPVVTSFVDADGPVPSSLSPEQVIPVLAPLFA